MNADLLHISFQSLGWALAHSIWQISLFVLVLAFVLPRLNQRWYNRHWPGAILNP